MTELPDELDLVEWEGEGGSLDLKPALPIMVRRWQARPALDGMIMRPAGALVVLLCMGTIGRLWLDLSFGTIVLGAGGVHVFWIIGKHLL